MTEQGVSRLVRNIDQIGQDITPKSLSGAIFSTVAVAALAAYSVVAVTIFYDKPLPLQITAKWTIVDGPVQPGPLYPMKVKCLVGSGCTVGLFYSSRTPFSKNCATQTSANFGASAYNSRNTMAADDIVTFYACYSDDPADGLFAWYDGASPFGIAIESVAPISGKVTSVFVPVHAGRTLMKLVNTTNATYPVGAFGHARAEWYPTLLSPEPLQDSVTAGSTTTFSSQSFIDAQWTEVLVFDRDPWSFVSTMGGAWTIMIGAAAVGHAAFTSLVLLRSGAQKAVDHARTSFATTLAQTKV